jgi:hypothetical protein
MTTATSTLNTGSVVLGRKLQNQTTINLLPSDEIISDDNSKLFIVFLNILENF